MLNTSGMTTKVKGVESLSMGKDRFQTVSVRSTNGFVQRLLGLYLRLSKGLWRHVVCSLPIRSIRLAYGRHVHALVLLLDERTQNHSTFVLRNRAELEVMRHLLDQKGRGSTLNIAVLACSKGVEAYSFMWGIRSARPDLRVRMLASDISQEILEFAKCGVYVRDSQSPKAEGDLTTNTRRDQRGTSIFERMTSEEVESIFELQGDQAKVRSWLKEGITWLSGDAGDPELSRTLGPLDVVVANRFLCHMKPPAAEKCLRNIARMVKPGGYLFVSGIDLDVRTKLAKDMGWKPVADLVKETYEGDPSLSSAWPLHYWGVEPFCEDRPDWGIRYASVFQIGERRDLA